MKKLLTIIFALNSLVAVANCNSSYSEAKVKKYLKGHLLSLSGPGAGAGGVLVFGNSFDWDGGGNQAGVNLALAMSISGIAMTSLGITSYYQAGRFKKVEKILDQSQVGMGRNLENLADNLTEKLDREILVSDITPIINQGNEDKVFCQDNQKLYNFRDLKKFIITHLE